MAEIQRKVSVSEVGKNLVLNTMFLTTDKREKALQEASHSPSVVHKA